jgi:hypothetical protein
MRECDASGVGLNTEYDERGMKDRQPKPEREESMELEIQGRKRKGKKNSIVYVGRGKHDTVLPVGAGVESEVHEGHLSQSP